MYTYIYIYMSADLTTCKLLHSIAQRAPADDHMLKTHLEMCSHQLQINIYICIYIYM